MKIGDFGLATTGTQKVSTGDEGITSLALDMMLVDEKSANSTRPGMCGSVMCMFVWYVCMHMYVICVRVCRYWNTFLLLP